MRLRILGPAAVLLLILMLPATASADFAHVVAPGETLTSVAAADGLSVSALAAANGLSPYAQIVAGSVLQIPPQSAGTVAAAVPAAGSEEAGESVADGDETYASASSGGYVVQPGDTLSGIAARAGTSVAQLAAMNGLNPNGVLFAGSTLALPGGGPVGGGTTQYVSTNPSAGGSSGPYPTPETVSGSEIGGIASADGVSAPLAQAVGWQESGWNNDMVSATGAVGVMQIEPYTWSWIQSSLAGGSLSPYSAADNVRGGVLLLHSLLASTGSDSMAAAAYYQGLTSLQQHGVLPATQQYVNSVMALEAQYGGG